MIEAARRAVECIAIHFTVLWLGRARRGVGGVRGVRKRDAWGAQTGHAGCAGRWAQARGLCAPGCAVGPAGCALGARSLF